MNFDLGKAGWAGSCLRLAPVVGRVGALLSLVLALGCGSRSAMLAGTGGDSGTGAGTGTRSASGSATTRDTGASGSRAGSSDGSGGSAGFPPVSQVRTARVDKVDLLLVVDNSIGMADKQELLAQSVPRFMRRLANPSCLSLDMGQEDVRESGDDGTCPAGYTHQFDPIDDIHIGVITSSLGGHGGDICSPSSPSGEYDPSENDRGLLRATLRPGLSSFNGQGFLAWDPSGRYPGSENDLARLANDFADHVVQAGEAGCGFEATLEGWYRFLIDPSPPLDMLVENGLAMPSKHDDGSIVVDPDVLTQRENFLRPDSLLAIVMLSDENDCSVYDGGIGYLTALAQLEGRRFNLPQSTSACDQDPNSPCCRSCGLNEATPPSGCARLSEDPKCQQALRDEPLNLRCFEQKRRFGLDLLYPVERYVDGLSQLQVFDTHRCNEDGQCPLVENPLFVAGVRDASMVFVAGIVGVPWQDVATNGARGNGTLVLKSAQQMARDGTWDLILGDPDTNTPPGDPLMIETPYPRYGVQPVTGEAMGAFNSENPQENSINGHEYYSTADDLQYACIFPLSTARDCSNPSGACDCTEADLVNNRPLCQPPGGGPAGLVQYYAKAYPGLRQLHVLRDVGTNAVVGSICPKQLATDQDDFAYQPALDALVDTMAPSFGISCLPRALPLDANGNTTCRVVEVTLLGADVPRCSERVGRTPVAPGSGLQSSALNYLESSHLCGARTVLDCQQFELCEIQQLAGRARDRCLSELVESDDGFCYVDPAQGVGSEQLVWQCADDEQQRLHFVGANGLTPVPDATVLLVCDE